MCDQVAGHGRSASEGPNLGIPVDVRNTYVPTAFLALNENGKESRRADALS